MVPLSTQPPARASEPPPPVALSLREGVFPSAARATSPRPLGPPARAWAHATLALAIGVTAVVLPLSLWRRPRTPRLPASAYPVDALAVHAPARAGGALPGVPGAAPGTAPAAALPSVAFRSVVCRAERTSRPGARPCARDALLEATVTRAVQRAAACLAPASGVGVADYAVAARFEPRGARVRVRVSPRAGLFTGAKTVGGCAAAIERTLGTWATAPLGPAVRSPVNYALDVRVAYPPR